MFGRTAGGVKTRKIAILAADGVEAASLKRLQQDLSEAGAMCKLVAPHLGSVSTANGRQLTVDFTFTNTASVMFDAVLIPGGNQSAAALSAMGEAVHFVLEAYKHCKTICAVNDGVQLLATLGFKLDKNSDVIAVPTAGVIIADARKVADGQVSRDFMAAIALHRHWDRLNIDAVPA
jgi:catalase